MRKSRIITLLLFCFTLALLAKPVFDIKLISSFVIPDTKPDPSFTKFCIADTLILIVDTVDSTNTKSFCYNFHGKRIDTFKIPPDSGYIQILFVNYLYDSKRIAIYDARRWGIDYYSLTGEYLKQKKLVTDWSIYNNIVEYKGKPYYQVYNLYEAADDDIVTTSMTWFRENEDGVMQPLRKLFFDKPRNHDPDYTPKNIFNWGFLIDSNRSKYMTMVEEKKNKYVITYCKDDKWIKSGIKKGAKEHLGRVFTGEDYYILASWTDQWQTTPSTGIFDLKGHRLLSLFKLTKALGGNKNVEILDIVGNRLVAYNPDTNAICIYNIQLEEK